MDEFKRHQIKSHKEVGCGCRLCTRHIKDRSSYKKRVNKAARAKMKSELAKDGVHAKLQADE